jgi:peptidyl-prolyl cis-trans isomerase SurA
LANIKDDYQFLQDMALNQKKESAMQDWIKKKAKSTYIRINSSFTTCPFENEGWIK